MFHVAVKLVELGRLSSGRAAALAGMARVEFFLELGRYRVFRFEAELSDLESDSPVVDRLERSGRNAGGWRGGNWRSIGDDHLPFGGAATD